MRSLHSAGQRLAEFRLVDKRAGRRSARAGRTCTTRRCSTAAHNSVRQRGHQQSPVSPCPGSTSPMKDRRAVFMRGRPMRDDRRHLRARRVLGRRHADGKIWSQLPRLVLTPMSAARSTNFANGDGVDMSGWELNLGNGPLYCRRLTAAPPAGTRRQRHVGRPAGNRAGLWEYTLYGPDRARVSIPPGVAGRFFANVDANTAVAGAFGAE